MMADFSKLPLSVLILTFNEEANLPACLDSVAGCDDVVVLDSGSTDRTAEIARAAGARVVTHGFENFAAQRNFAHAAIEFRHPFVFHLDADEALTPELAAECAALDPGAPPDGYYAAPRMMFDGQWLRRCTDYPAWQARCVRARGFQFIQVGHGQREAPAMRLGYLRGSYLHDISVRDENEWERKHRRYAGDEAAQFLAERRPVSSALRAAVAGPALERRRALKHLSYLLPGRPALRYFYQYILRGGWRDGTGARRYCRLLARYEGFTVEEIRRRRADGHG
jgi:glycosyltransferase involved in cell wall biosynthesis